MTASRERRGVERIGEDVARRRGGTRAAHSVQREYTRLDEPNERELSRASETKKGKRGRPRDPARHAKLNASLASRVTEPESMGRRRSTNASSERAARRENALVSLLSLSLVSAGTFLANERAG